MARDDLNEVELRIIEPLSPLVGEGAPREDDRRIVRGVLARADLDSPRTLGSRRDGFFTV